MLEYIIATFVLVCPSRAGHMVGLAGTVSELFAKMLFFTRPSYVKGRKIVKFRYQSQTPARHVEGHFAAGRSSSSSRQEDPGLVQREFSRLLGEGDIVRQQSRPFPDRKSRRSSMKSLASWHRAARRGPCSRMRKRHGPVSRARLSTT